MTKPKPKPFTKKEVRTAIANYMFSEGCSCCHNIDLHKKHKNILGKMLGVKMYSDKSGYDFSIYRDI